MTIDLRWVFLGSAFALTVLTVLVCVLGVALVRVSRQQAQHVERMSVILRAGNAGEGIAAVERLARLEELRAAGPKPPSGQAVAPEKAPLLARVWRRAPPPKKPLTSGG